MSKIFLALVLFLGTVSPVTAADRFYEDLLRDGIANAEAGDTARAAQVLRLACFGLLEEPTTLSRCLVHLALAQAKMNQREAFNSTAERLLAIENRFAGYTQADLGSEPRRRFETHLREWIEPETLTRSPTFRHLAVPDQADRPLNEEPSTPPVAPLGSESEPDPSPEIAAALKAARDAQRGGTGDDLSRELDRMRRLVEQYPEKTDLRHAAASLAYRLGRWRESKTFFEGGGELAADQPVLLFYYAVVLYKIGDFDKAAEILERGLPTLRRNAFVDEYIEKILGPQGH